MEKILNITNGDSAVNIMKDAGIPGVFLPWQDVLHDGPVPEKLSLEELSKRRAQFIIDLGWGEPDTIRSNFIQRDKQLQSFKDYEEVRLWFEHDLYDQLQILQILDWFSQQPRGNTKLTIICTEQYLGMLSPSQMKELLSHEETISEQQLTLARRAWTAFRSPTPSEWENLLNEDTSVFPFLKGAVLRLLEEYPDCKNGLSRTAQKILSIIDNSEKRPWRIFQLYQETEERQFMGDASFGVIIHQLLESKPPMIKLAKGIKQNWPMPNQELLITPAGKEVLAGKRMPWI